MKFIIDAHLPKAIGSYFIELGHETVHTSDLVLGNKTDDQDITKIANEENAVVISKDNDFYHSFLLFRKPPKLILVKVGNMKLADVKALFQREAEKLLDLLGNYDLIELHKDKIIAID
ncbi:MAG: DUF5615 family PIN-like protein [Lewinellaceae bacterium]|nr:DUF5615 family PIN-like protein [Phaeodactylibacter sp.]MCB9039854.1 DUF5615 family PIN-like protein [Lewinellaceae bacterium]